ncbi:MAG: LacI family transcriptional regulator, partial [Acidobacteria bacterium]|nr:LacI family transcriptional regulator [Acidobacteriota bacterium]
MKQRLNSRVTLTDIARDVGVSLATVSRTLNGTGRIKASTREKIFQAARRLRYLGETESRSIGSAQRMIGLLMPWYGTALGMHDSIIHVGQEAIRHIAEEQDYGVIFGSFGDKRKQTVGDRLLNAGDLAGVILFRTREEEELIRPIQQKGIPYIIIYRNLEGTSLSYVGIDHRAAMASAMQHLLDLGFGEIGLLCGDTSYPSMKAYQETFLSTLKKNSLAVESGWIRQSSNSEQSGYEVTAALLRQSPPRALICCSDRIAFGALKAA